jgi:UDP-glucose 4-epimerase
MAPSTVLVTGASRFLGGQLAARLAADPSIDRVLGMDAAPPNPELRRQLGRTEFVRADLRSPLIANVISRARVDTVVHTSLSAHPPGSLRGPSSTLAQTNVIGTMQLLAACQSAATVTRLIVKSTAAVYGASPRDPAVFMETDQPSGTPASAYARDVGEIEGYVRGFARRREDVAVTVVRFSNVIGPRIQTPLTRYLSLPVVPTVLGRDERLQLLHEEDALAVLEQAVRERLPGVFNVAGSGVLLLSQAIRRAGRIPLTLPTPAITALGWLAHGTGLAGSCPEPAGLLHIGRVMDTTRLRTVFGFEPRWTTLQAFDDWVRGQAVRPVCDPRWLVAAERRVLALAAQLR